MSTSVDKMTEALMDKMFTKDDVDALVKKIRPIFLKEVEKNLIKAAKDFINVDSLQEALYDTQTDLAYDIARQLKVSFKFSNPKKKGGKK